MSVNLSDLLKKRSIEKIEPDSKAAVSLLKNAESDLAAAEDNLKLKHSDWALAIAYNAMLSAGMALMAFKGYRTHSESHHVAVVEFCAALLPAESSGLVSAFNRYRTRRHDVVYGETGSDAVGEDEAKRALANASKFVEVVRSVCKL